MPRLDSFSTVRTEGGLLPAEILSRIATGDTTLGGLKPEDYHLGTNERINEAVSRSWSRLVGAWTGFKEQLGKLAEDDFAVGLTRERWLLILFSEFGYGRLVPAKAVQIDGKDYPVSHFWGSVPIHLMGYRVNLDRKTEKLPGAAKKSPHSLIQEFLNRSQGHLWGFVSNGANLRVLRDSVSLTRQAYVEFDIEGMMEGGVYSDFFLLWLLCHQSRVEGEDPAGFWLERWAREARDQGVRALDTLRDGVEDAIRELGNGFLTHPNNQTLRENLRNGTLNRQDYYRQLLRLVYRLIFLFVAEDRELLLLPDADPEKVRRYKEYYSASRIRRIAGRFKGTKHVDLYRGLMVVMERLSSDNGSPELGLPALGSFLWSPLAVPDLVGSDISNRDFLKAIRALGYTISGRTLYPADFKNLGAEELGSVYESLLELHPDLTEGVFSLKTAAGHERKSTGSYYTHTSLITCLLDSALDPVLDKAARKADPERAILDLKVCDPASGSGHFLVAAAHRIAKRLAQARTGEDEPAPEAVRKALRDVIAHCIYGVDINPMAVELCKVSLWMEAMEPGKPLAFLEHHIRCGNSLLGATLALLDKGIPDEAFTPIEGDDREICRKLKRENQNERAGMRKLWGKEGEPWNRLGDLARALVELDDVADDTILGVRQKEQNWEKYIKSAGYEFGHLWADAWCAAFVWKKIGSKDIPYPITEETFRKIEYSPHTVSENTKAEILRIAVQYGFFHWHLEFPSVFRAPSEGEVPENQECGWIGGFDVVLGNPPWERVKLQEKEWFAERRPDIANAPNAAARRRMIESLKDEDPKLYRVFKDDKRLAEGESILLRNTGRYPLCGRGDVNTYAVFAELKRNIVNKTGRVGCIVPTGIATDDTTKFFFQDLVENRSLVSLYDFENSKGIFPGVHRSYKFSLLTLSGYERPSSEGAEFIFFAHKIEDLGDEDRRFTLTDEEIELINPNTKTCPIFRSKRDAELTKYIYRRVPVLIKEGPPEENPWGISFKTMFHMTNDSHLFRTKEELEGDGFSLFGNIFISGDDKYLPLWEDWMIHHFEHRYQTNGRILTKNKQFTDPEYTVMPRYWVSEENVKSRESYSYSRGYLFAFRNNTRTTDSRSVICTVIPFSAVGNTVPLIIFNTSDFKNNLFHSYITSFVFDYSARQKIGGYSLNFFIFKQLPIISPKYFEEDFHIIDSSLFLMNCLELTYTAWDMESFAKDCGYNGPPFRWNEERRFLLRCELDAAFFHLYLGTDKEWKEKGSAELLEYFPTPRDAVEYIMETFPIVKRKDEEKYDEYRTKRVILEIYDEMAEAIKTGIPYKTCLDPPPADPRVAHPSKSE